MKRNEARPEDLRRIVRSFYEREASPIKAKTRNIIEKAAKSLGVLKETAGSMLDESKSLWHHDDSQGIAVENFGNKLVSLTNVEPPPEPEYQAVVSYLDALKRIHGDCIRAGRQWIPKLPRETRPMIRKIEGELNYLSTVVDELSSTINHLKRLKQIEKLVKDADEIVANKESLAGFREKIERLEQELLQASREESGVSEKLRQLDEEDLAKTLSRLESQSRQTDQNILSLFQSMEKPIEKLLKLDERGEVNLDGPTKMILALLIDEPVRTVYETQPDKLVPCLNTLQDFLELGKIELKSSRRDKALTSLRELCNIEFLQAMIRRKQEQEAEKRRAEAAASAAGLLSQRQDLEKKRKSLREKIAALTSEKERVKEAEKESAQKLRDRMRELESKLASYGFEVKISG